MGGLSCNVGCYANDFPSRAGRSPGDIALSSRPCATLTARDAASISVPSWPGLHGPPIAFSCRPRMPLRECSGMRLKGQWLVVGRCFARSLPISPKPFAGGNTSSTSPRQNKTNKRDWTFNHEHSSPSPATGANFHHTRRGRFQSYLAPTPTAVIAGNSARQR